MATDAKGNNHKAAGRPDGGRFDRKAGQGSDDDLDFEAADTRLSAAMPDMDAEDRRGLIDVVIGGPDEDDPVAVAGYLDSLDPGVRFILSDKARALEARTLDDPDWCDAHAEELMAAVPDIGAGALTGVIRYWRADDPDASDRLAEAVTDDPDIADELCYERAVSDRLFRQRKPWASRDRLLGNPHLTEAQRSALTTPISESGFTRTNDPKNCAPCSSRRTNSTGLTRWPATAILSTLPRSWRTWSAPTRRSWCADTWAPPASVAAPRWRMAAPSARNAIGRSAGTATAGARTVARPPATIAACIAPDAIAGSVACI